MSKYDDIIIENYSRIKRYFQAYDPLFGDEQQIVVSRRLFRLGNFQCLLPVQMFDDYYMLDSPELQDLSDGEKSAFLQGLMKIRCQYDFEYWCYACVNIEDKLSKQLIPFVLNYGQRKTAHSFEVQRLSGEPIRVIICKARQWGGSTVTQMYMLWLQIHHYKRWHSAIISQLKSQAANIRNMISRVIAYYPEEDEKLDLNTFEGQPNVKIIPQRKSKVYVGSAEMPDAFRSFDFSMLHLSEVGLWKSTDKKSADDLAQSIYSTIPDVPGSFIVMESTAKGVGNFFHRNYLAAKTGTSSFQPIFVSWFENINNADFKRDATGQSILRDKFGIPVSDITDYNSVIKNLSDYQKFQWQQGATLEGITWYARYQQGHQWNNFQMKSEYPTTDTEAFQTKSNKFFEDKFISYARYTCREPLLKCDIRGDSLTGEESLKNIYLDKDGFGQQANFSIWIMPEDRQEGMPYITNQYVVVVDIGGVYTTSDWSVISVFDRSTLNDPCGSLERAATWRGHVAPDILAWKAVQIATMYNNALLVIESNTLETRYRKEDQTYEGSHFYTVLNEISHFYSNLYMRETTPEKANEKTILKYGWHTNVRTKTLAYDMCRSAFRNNAFTEHDARVVDEMEWLEMKPDGALGAIKGEHDDLIDTVAIGIYVSAVQMDLPKEINPKMKITSGKSGSNIGFASF